MQAKEINRILEKGEGLQVEFKKATLALPYNIFETIFAFLNKNGGTILLGVDYGGKHHESSITAFWQSYGMLTKFNMDYRRATFSSQICTQQMTREEAIEKLKIPPFQEEELLNMKEYVAKKYKISVSELDAYLSLPPKTYKDFPNQKNTIDFFYNLYNKIFKDIRI